MFQKTEGVRVEAGRDLRLDFVFEILSCAYIVAVVVLCWTKPLWTSLLLGAWLCALLWFWRERADAAAMVAAAMLGTPAEVLCVEKGVWTYHAPGLVFGIPVWIPLVWAYLLCLFRRISLSIHGFTLEVWPAGRMPVRRILFTLAGGVILVYFLATVAVIKRPIALTYTAFMVAALVCCRREQDILIFLVGAPLGTLGEYICMKLGFWEYHYPFFRSVGMPISLPLAWGLSSVIIGRIAGLFSAKETKR